MGMNFYQKQALQQSIDRDKVKPKQTLQQSTDDDKVELLTKTATIHQWRQNLAINKNCNNPPMETKFSY